MCFSPLNVQLSTLNSATKFPKVDKSDSWSWKTMVELRDKMKPFVTVKIGDGKSTSIWYDSWNGYAALASVISKRDIYKARLYNNATVADMIKDGEWVWPKEWWNKFPILKDVKAPNLCNKEDYTVWIDSNKESSQFSIRSVWNIMKAEYPKVE
ncbi:hypothetical protein Tco_0806568 [Tanacetum coccineum]